MGKKQDLINKVFGLLKVIGESPNKVIENGRFYVIDRCECACGTIKDIHRQALTTNRVRSCGSIECTKAVYDIEKSQETRYTDIVGLTFGFLTVIGRTANKNGKPAFLCKCKCGRNTSVRKRYLISGHTKSCGKCIKKDPAETSARAVFGKYQAQDLKRGGQMTLTFGEFYQLSQLPCFYCGTELSNCSNAYLHMKLIPQSTIDLAYYRYNGIDRVDNTGSHTIDNVVPCCKICNSAKMDQSQKDFLELVEKIHQTFIIQKCAKTMIKQYGLSAFQSIQQINSSILSSAKGVWYHRYHNNRGDTLPFELFFLMSQENCYYCGGNLGNRSNKYQGDKTIRKETFEAAYFIYNGLDRIDSSLPHIETNVVPCCHKCNSAKNDQSLTAFTDWILRLHNFQQTKISPI